MRAEAVVILGRRERGRGIDLEEDAAALTRLVVDPGQALLDQLAAGAAAASSALSWRREGMARTELMPA